MCKLIKLNEQGQKRSYKHLMDMKRESNDYFMNQYLTG